MTRARVLRKRHDLIGDPKDRDPIVADIVRHSPRVTDLTRPFWQVITNSPLANRVYDFAIDRCQSVSHGIKANRWIRLVGIVYDVVYTIRPAVITIFIC